MWALILWRGIMLGLGAAAPIGPVNVEIARRSLRGGFRSGFGVGCGAVTVDVSYAALLGVGMQWLMGQRWMPQAQLVVGLMGAGLLAYLGIGSLLNERCVMRMEVEGLREKPSRSYWTGLLMTATNPMTLGFWFVVVPAAAGGVSLGRGWGLPVLCVGVFMGAMTWVVFFATVMSGAGRLGKRWVLAGADAMGGVILLWFSGFAVIASYGVWRMGGGPI